MPEDHAHGHPPTGVLDISNLKPGDHLCILYETEHQHQELLTKFISEGLEQHQKVVYIVDSHTAGVILEYMEKSGLAADEYLASGQFSILTAEDSYLLEGYFDPAAMIELLRQNERQALSEGYSAMRVTGEMTWVLRGQPGSDRLVEYEARLNDFLPPSKVIGLCQYDRWCFDSRVLLDVISTHPIVVLGTEAYDNFYYIPPDQFLRIADDATSTLNRWIEQLQSRRTLEKSLRDSEELYHTIFNSGNDAIYVYRVDEDMEPCEFLEVNDRACAVTGYSRDKLMKMSRMDLVSPDCLDAFRDYLGSLSDKRRTVYELVLTTKNGKHVPVEVSANLIELEGRKMVMAIERDISERKQAEEALRASEERFLKVFDANPLAICITAMPGGRLIDVNPGYADLTGYPREYLIGRTTVELGLSPSLDERDKVVGGLMERGGFRDVEVRIRNKQGDILSLSASSVLTELNGENCAITMLAPRDDGRKDEASPA